MKNTLHLGLFASSLTTLFLSGVMSAFGYDLKMIPPDELIINGEEIISGTFSITEGFGYYTNDGTNVLEENLGSTSHSGAIIGNPTPFTLFPNIPDQVEVLRLIGNFTSDNPVLNPAAAEFDIIVGGFNQEVVDFTYYLPATTSQALNYQITDVESDPAVEDNTNTFLDGTLWSSPTISLTPPSSPEQIIETFVQTGNTWYISSTGPTPPPPPITRGCAALLTTGSPATRIMNPHGGSTSFQQNCPPVPEPSTNMGIIALGIIGGGVTLKRKLKSANSTEK